MVLAALAVSGAAFAQTKAPEPDYTLSFNVGAVTDYRFRGISQTSLKPALQGGPTSRTRAASTWAPGHPTSSGSRTSAATPTLESRSVRRLQDRALGPGFDVGLLRYLTRKPARLARLNPDTTEWYIAGTSGRSR